MVYIGGLWEYGMVHRWDGRDYTCVRIKNIIIYCYSAICFWIAVASKYTNNGLCGLLSFIVRTTLMRTKCLYALAISWLTDANRSMAS
jgi:hypothetical protein